MLQKSASSFESHIYLSKMNQAAQKARAAGDVELSIKAHKARVRGLMVKNAGDSACVPVLVGGFDLKSRDFRRNFHLDDVQTHGFTSSLQNPRRCLSF